MTLFLLILCALLLAWAVTATRYLLIGLPPKPDVRAAEKWFTVAVYERSDKFSDTKQPYYTTVILKCSSWGNRRAEVSYMSGGVSYPLGNWFQRQQVYLLYFEPWESGMISLEVLAKNVKELKVVPNDDLLSLSPSEIINI